MAAWRIFSEPMQISWPSNSYSITDVKGTGLSPLGAGEMHLVSPFRRLLSRIRGFRKNSRTYFQYVVGEEIEVQVSVS